MAKQKYLRSTAPTKLQDEVPQTLSLYGSEEPWLDSFFHETKFALDSSLEVPDDLKLEEPGGPGTQRL